MYKEFLHCNIIFSYIRFIFRKFFECTATISLALCTMRNFATYEPIPATKTLPHLPLVFEGEG